MPMPKFDGGSWDNTIWSLWGVLYATSWADSEKALQTQITVRYGELQDELAKIGPQVGELKKTVANWRSEAKSYGRTIAYSEATNVALRLDELLALATAQVESDRLLASKPKPKKPVVAKVPGPVVEVPDADDDDDDEDGSLGDLLASYAQNSGLGRSKATATRVKAVVRPYVAPTPAQNWVAAQRQMASWCDNGIKFGEHAVNQDSVLRQLRLVGGYTVWQYRDGPENGHRRIMKAESPGGNLQFWTIGLTHQSKRDKGEFSVYLRDGASNRFTHVSGEKRPEHRAAEEA